MDKRNRKPISPRQRPHRIHRWTGQQLRGAFPFDQLPRYLLRDRDAIFGEESNP
jgi:hypothetical protein